MSNVKLEAAKKMLNQFVYVLTSGGWFGEVVEVIDEETIVVMKGRRVEEVSIFDIRSL